MKTQIFQLLSTNGDGTGETDAIQNYSASPTSFYFRPQSNFIANITSIIIGIQDAGNFDIDKYGKNIVLTNGITVLHKSADGETLNSLTSIVIKTSADWILNAHNIDWLKTSQGDDLLTVVFDFEQRQRLLKLDCKKGEYIEALFNDDFSGLTHHRYNIKGYFENHYHLN